MRASVFLLDVHEDGDAVVVAPHGEIDLATVDQVDRALRSAQGSPVAILDLRRVRFMDSAGLGLIVRHHRLALEQGRQLRVVRGPEEIQRLFELTGLTERLLWADGLGGPPAGSTAAPG